MTDYWPDGTPVTPWADPWRDIAADLRDALDQRQAPLIPQAKPETWIAYCAPGYQLTTALHLMLTRSEHVTRVEETPHLPPGMTILIRAGHPDFGYPDFDPAPPAADD